MEQRQLSANSVLISRRDQNPFATKMEGMQSEDVLITGTGPSMYEHLM